MGQVVQRCGAPEKIKAKLQQKGEIVSKMINDVMALKWMDKCPMAMLTTVHDDSVVTKQRQTRVVWRTYANLLWSNATMSSCKG